MKKNLFLLLIFLCGLISCQQNELMEKNPVDEDLAAQVDTRSTLRAERNLTDAEKQQLKRSFPKLDVDKVKVTGESSSRYNCIAWSMEIDYKWINPKSSLSDFENHYKNAKSLEGAKNNYEVTTAGGNAIVDGWGDSRSMTHGSIIYSSNTWESKLGPEMRITHDRKGLEGGDYGYIKTSFNYARSYTDLSAVAAEVALKDIELSAKEEQAVIEATKIVDISIRNKFNILFEEWLNEWISNPKTMFSSNTYDTAILPQFDELVTMGPSIIPLIMEKLLDEENFIGLVLYEALQNNDKKKITYTGEDCEVLEGEQNRAKRTIQKWLID